jgi:signal transduction histidine kinase
MAHPTGGPSLRQRVMLSIVAVTTLAVVVFGLPLGIAVQRLQRAEAVSALQEDATRVAASVPDTLTGDSLSASGKRLLATVASTSIGVYDVAGHRMAGAGPLSSGLASGSGTAQVRSGVEGSDLVVIAPIPSDQKTVGSVRASEPFSVVTARVYRAWATMAVLAAAAIAVAAVIAWRQAVRLAAPLERLTRDARALGDGDFTVRAGRFGVREADAASLALQDTAAHLGRLLARERSFTSDVSHQLRTPLTALRVGLESAITRPGADPVVALRDALARSEHLSAIVADLDSLRSQPGFAPMPVDVAALLTEAGTRWEQPLMTRDRLLAIVMAPDLPRGLAPPAVIRQILDVLISNALWHGEGTVTLAARQDAGRIAIEVSDEGPGLPGGMPEHPDGADGPDGHGRGLPLARSLTEAAGGSLELRHASPAPVFTLSLLAADDVTQPADRGSNR